MLEVLCSLATATAIGLAAFGLGRPPLRWLSPKPLHPPTEAVVWSVALGLLLAGLAVALLDRFAALGTLSIAVLTLVGLLSGMLELACLAAGEQPLGTLRHTIRTTWQGCIANPLACFLSGATVLLLLSTLIGALAPPLDPVVLSHELDPCKHALLTGSFTGSLSTSSQLDLAQVWWLWALVLDGPVGANLVAWGIGLLLALATVSLAGQEIGPPWNCLAGVVALVSPAVTGQLGVPGGGLAAALMVTLSLLAIRRFARIGDKGWLAMTAAMLGATFAIDVPAGLLAALASGGALLASSSALREKLLDLTILFGVAVLVGLPWLPAANPSLELAAANTAKGSLLACGPLILIGLAGLAIGGDSRRFATSTGLILLSALAASRLSEPQSITVLPIALLASAAAAGAANCRRLSRPALGAVIAIACLVLVVDVSEQLLRAAPRVAVATGRQSRGDYLARHQGAYRAAAVFNQIRRQGQRLLTQDQAGFYFSALTTHAAPVDSHTASKSQRSWPAAARAAGCEYLLLAEPVSPERSPSTASDAGAAVAPENLPSSAEVIPILEYRFADDNNRCIRYRLWKLQGSRPTPSNPSSALRDDEQMTARPGALAR